MFRTLRGLIQDRYERATGRRDPLTPPEALITTIGGDFHGVGREFFRHFQELGGLRPTDRVLDIGCGCGRMAVPLIPYLRDGGGYWGFDVLKGAIRWCRRAIGRRHPNFHFEHAELYNRMYRRKTNVSAATYRFPYPDGFFDFAFATSVFTHLVADETAHYLDEVVRVLKPGGRTLFTFYLMNDEARAAVSRTGARFRFAHRADRCWLERADDPPYAVAYDEATVREFYRARGLSIAEPIRFGVWCGRQSPHSWQDIVCAAYGECAGK